MIDFIIGDIVDLKDEWVVIQNNNLGYRVFISDITRLELEIGQKDIMLYTETIVREDAFLLYGFVSESEKEVFQLLRSVSRIGPRVAIGVLSTLRPNDIKKAIITEDIDALTEAPGIGKKTAERVILELRDKVDEADLIVGETEQSKDNIRLNQREAVEALMALGYRKYEVENVIKDLRFTDENVEEIIRLSLIELSKK